MALSIYNIVNNQLRSLSFFTELLESFDWNEEETEKFYKDVSECLLSKEVEQAPSLLEAIPLFEAKLRIKGYPKFQIGIVKKMIENQANELIEMANMEVH